MLDMKTNFRIAADIGGTFTDVAAFNETTGELRPRQDLVDARTAGSGRA
jgi:N-methylhydantoinase A/oxoprolinase/acetone carboxylase beta subunit